MTFKNIISSQIHAFNVQDVWDEKNNGKNRKQSRIVIKAYLNVAHSLKLGVQS